MRAIPPGTLLLAIVTPTTSATATSHNTNTTVSSFPRPVGPYPAGPYPANGPSIHRAGAHPVCVCGALHRLGFRSGPSRA